MKSYEVLKFESLESTNDYVKARLGSIRDRTLVVAGFQTLGRGRRDRTWESVADMNFLGTFYKRETKSSVYQSMMIGVVAVVRALDALGVKACIKPPNDVYVNDRKIAGILAEVIHRNDQHVIIGMGINVNEHKDPPAISLHDVTRRPHDLDRFTAHIISTMESLEAERGQVIFDHYLRYIPFGRISAYNKEVQGVLESIDRSFNCIVGGEEVSCGSLTFEYK